MAFSRLYLGVHYPSDVAAGAALGTVLGSLGR
jgi:undecaprenyl-diphosphatase